MSAARYVLRIVRFLDDDRLSGIHLARGLKNNLSVQLDAPVLDHLCGGGAGLAAAIAAGQQNKSVIIVEKNGEVGGDTLVCGAIYNTPDEALQKKATMGDAVKRIIGFPVKELFHQHVSIFNILCEDLFPAVVTGDVLQKDHSHLCGLHDLYIDVVLQIVRKDLQDLQNGYNFTFHNPSFFAVSVRTDDKNATIIGDKTGCVKDGNKHFERK